MCWDGEPHAEIRKAGRAEHRGTKGKQAGNELQQENKQTNKNPQPANQHSGMNWRGNVWMGIFASYRKPKSSPLNPKDKKANKYQTARDVCTHKTTVGGGTASTENSACLLSPFNRLSRHILEMTTYNQTRSSFVRSLGHLN